MSHIPGLTNLQLLVVILLSFSSAQANADEGRGETAEVALSSRSDIDSGPFCGIYALYAAAMSLQLDVQMSTLFSGKYLDLSQQGSHVQDLLKAAADHSIPAYAVYGIDVDALSRNGKPTLMLLDERSSGVGLGHWVLLLGRTGKSYRVYDSNFGVQNWSGAELLSSWRGTAIVIDQTSSRPIIHFDNGLKRASWLAAPIAIFVFAAWSQRARLRRMERMMPVENGKILTFLFTLTGAACFWAILTIAVDSAHPLRNLDMVRFISCQRSSDNEISQVQWQDCVDAVLVDARLSNAYYHSHLKGAINLPISLSGIPLKRELQALNKSKRLVVYCQSRECSWAEAMCQRLTCLGYDAAILEGGVSENATQLVSGSK